MVRRPTSTLVTTTTTVEKTRNPRARSQSPCSKQAGSSRSASFSSPSVAPVVITLASATAVL